MLPTYTLMLDSLHSWWDTLGNNITSLQLYGCYDCAGKTSLQNRRYFFGELEGQHKTRGERGVQWVKNPVLTRAPRSPRASFLPSRSPEKRKKQRLFCRLRKTRVGRYYTESP